MDRPKWCRRRRAEQNEENNNQPYFFTMSMRFVADDMVAWPEAGGRSISFVVKGTPVVQKRTVMAWKGRVRPHLLDPSMNAKRLFAQAVRIEMAAIGLSQEIYFTETTAIRCKVKFVLPRPKKDLVMTPTPHLVVGGASSFPRGKDIDNLLKFVMDALEETIYVNDTNIIRVEAEKCYATDILEAVGWTELRFWKVVFTG
jgi:Holliday junction resolvase RusA-like endonuclease